jgi:hypothetical protein
MQFGTLSVIGALTVSTRPSLLNATRLVIEVRQYDQYAIRIDGYRRITLRNRNSFYGQSPASRLMIDCDLHTKKTTFSYEPGSCCYMIPQIYTQLQCTIRISLSGAPLGI